MILVDTSVLIDYLKGIENTSVSAFGKILENGTPYGINELIYLEVLQGARTITEYRKLQEYLETIPFYFLTLGKESYERAAQLNFVCRRSGVTIRSTIDLLIAQTAIENDLFLLHNDHDFTNMAKAIKALKIFEPVS
ncbi:MAG: PIN domain nuclease [Smithellaceae bacterium]|jgi:predicted nucleic acid-binding protein|nr:PIN domain nuclease [Smithellaceae bacterium]